jgi:RES domain-containing protein
MPDFDPAALNDAPRSSFSDTAYRHQAPGFDPTSGEGARRQGGRFNPPRSFPVLYLCATRPCVIAELRNQAKRQGLEVTDLLPRELWAVSLKLDVVLDLGDDNVRKLLGLELADLVRPDHAFTQQIGEAAHERRFQAIRSPSATRVDEILVVFPENLAGATLTTRLERRWQTPMDLGEA